MDSSQGLRVRPCPEPVRIQGRGRRGIRFGSWFAICLAPDHQILSVQPAVQPSFFFPAPSDRAGSGPGFPERETAKEGRDTSSSVIGGSLICRRLWTRGSPWWMAEDPLSSCAVGVDSLFVSLSVSLPLSLCPSLLLLPPLSPVPPPYPPCTPSTSSSFDFDLARNSRT